jgi:hypothetical protein
MNANEAAAWKAYTASNTHQWKVDPCHSKPDDLLLSYGGEAGKFASIRGSVVEIGTYSDAIPHIGDALFKVEGRRDCGSTDDAVRFLLERGGIAVLVAFMGL